MKLKRVGRLGRRSLPEALKTEVRCIAVRPGQECLKRERTLRLSAEAAPSTRNIWIHEGPPEFAQEDLRKQCGEQARTAEVPRSWQS